MHTSGNLPCFLLGGLLPNPWECRKRHFYPPRLFIDHTVKATGIAALTTCVNCMQYGRFPLKIHTKNSCVNLYTSSYTQTFCMQICMYFFTTANIADAKLETDIVKKRPFAVKKKTTYYTVSLTANVMFCPLSLLSVPGLMFKKNLKSPFGNQLEKYSCQVQIFSRQFVYCKWRSS